MIIIGSGSRDWKDYRPIAKVMRNITIRYGINNFMYYHGAQRGFDKLSAMQLGLLKHKQIQSFPYIEALGKAGGMARNELMLETALKFEGISHILLVAMPLPQSIGTFGMISICKAANIQIEIYNADGELR